MKWMILLLKKSQQELQYLHPTICVFPWFSSNLFNQLFLYVHVFSNSLFCTCLPVKIMCYLFLLLPMPTSVASHSGITVTYEYDITCNMWQIACAVWIIISPVKHLSFSLSQEITLRIDAYMWKHIFAAGSSGMHCWSLDFLFVSYRFSNSQNTFSDSQIC